MANYGMRTGELLQLRWKDVKANSVTGLAEIKIRAETSKVGEDRENTGRRADIFLRRKVYSTWNNENDYVFSDFKQRRMMSKDRLYRYYKKLCDEIELEEKGWKKRDIYALRHFYISLHLLLGKVDAYTIARWAGTSLVQIQKHYDNVKDKQVSKKMNYDFNWDELASEFGFDERDDLKESKEYL
jgi:integrase